MAARPANAPAYDFDLDLDASWEEAGERGSERKLSDTGEERLRMQQSVAQFEDAFEREMERDRERREQIRKRASNRSRARYIQKSEQVGRVRFSVLALALTLTVVIVVIVMFETLALIAG